jgi:DNA polymerase I-like protein with 3'-5' exonuclease and polymerase domains
MNVFPYRPPGNDIKLAAQTGHTIEECIPDMWETIRAIKENGGANCILALGALALNALTGENGIKKWRGSILSSLYHNSKVVPSIHPANLFERRGEKGLFPYSGKVYMQLDFNRAVEESQTPELELPHRFLHTAKRSIELLDFVERKTAKGRWIFSVDIEALRCVPMMCGLAADENEGISFPLINLTQLDSRFYVPDYEIAEMWRILDKLFRDPRVKILGQNFKYDQEKMECVGFRFPHGIYADLSLLAKLVNPEFPASLEFITSIYTRQPYYKDEYRDYNPKKDPLSRVFNYNGLDVTVTFENFLRLKENAEEFGLWSFFTDFMMQLHPIYKEMEELGMEIDFEVRDKLFAKYTERQLQLEDELFTLLGFPVNVNSPKQMIMLLYHTLKIPRRKDASEDTLVQLLANRVKNEKHKKILNLIIDIRRIRNAKSKISFRPDYDGRMRTNFRIAGTEAGRTSTSILKRPVRVHQMGLSGHSITKHGEFGGDIRTMFVPTKLKTGEKLIFMNADESQAEARVVALLSEDEELLSWFEQKIDVHGRTASFIFGGDEKNYCKTKEHPDPPERHIGKIGRHAYGYGTSAKRLMLESNTQARRFHIDIQISEWRAKQILAIMDEKAPKISQVYWPAVRAIAHGNRIIRTAHGRVRQFLNRLNDELFREMYSYIPQADVSDHLKVSMIAIKKRFKHHIRYVMEAHDAFAAEIPETAKDDVAGYTREVMESPIDFSGCTISRGLLVIPCDIEFGENYKDFKKWKGPVLELDRPSNGVDGRGGDPTVVR